MKMKLNKQNESEESVMTESSVLYGAGRGGQTVVKVTRRGWWRERRNTEGRGRKMTL